MQFLTNKAFVEEMKKRKDGLLAEPWHGDVGQLLQPGLQRHQHLLQDWAGAQEAFVCIQYHLVLHKQHHVCCVQLQLQQAGQHHGQVLTFQPFHLHVHVVRFLSEKYTMVS